MGPAALAMIPQAWTSFYTPIVLLIIATLFLFLFMSDKNRRYRLPPGPVGLPFVGHLPFVLLFGIENFTNWAARRYGPVMTLWFGPHPKVFINDVKLAHQALRGHSCALAGRRESDLDMAIGQSVSGLGFGDYTPALQAQKFLFGKVARKVLAPSSGFEELVCRHMQQFLDNVLRQKGQTFDPYDETCIANASIFYELLHGVDGQEIRKDDTFINTAVNQNGFVGKFFTILQITETWPFLKYVLWHPYSKLLQCFSEVHEYFKNVVTRRSNLPTSKKTLNVTDMFVELASVFPKEEKERLGMKNEHLHLRLLMDFNLAGLETVFRTNHWGVYFLATYPVVQDKLFKEIGDAGMIKYNDRHNYPYLQAVNTEILRMAMVAPFLLEKRLREAVNIGGWLVPENTCLFVNAIYLARNPDIWEDPYQFRPERFITGEGHFNSKGIELFMPFSAGKRRCPGEDIAKRIIFHFLVSLVQGTRVTLPPGKQADFSRTVLLTVQPNRFDVIVQPR